MDLYRLRSFTVLAEQLHFGRAARSLNLSQPALTKQIRRLEAEVGGALFERGTHGTELSALGRQLLPAARGAIEGIERFLAEGRQVATGLTGRLRIGFGFHTLDLVPKQVVAFRRRYPGVDVSLQDMSTLEQLRALKARQLDLGFARLAAVPKLATRPIGQDRLALVVPESRNPTEPLIRTVADCAKRSFVVIAKARAPGFHAHILACCAEAGFHPRIAQEVREFTTAVALVQAGMGVSVMPVSLHRRLRPFDGVRVIPLEESNAQWTVGAAWLPGDTNPALHTFLALLEEQDAGSIASGGAGD